MFDLIRDLGDVTDEEMYEVFNMGCGFCCVVADDDELRALERLRERYPAAGRIGRATGEPGAVVRS